MSDARPVMLIDADTIERLGDRLDRIEHLLTQATIAPPPRWITRADYAAKVGKSPATVRRWVREGRLVEQNGLVRNPDV